MWTENSYMDSRDDMDAMCVGYTYTTNIRRRAHTNLFMKFSSV